MAIDIVTIPCLSDNYAYLIHESDTGETALVDAPEASPIIDELSKRGWSLSTLLITHHHNDHIDGVEALREKYAPRVVGCAADAHRLPELDLAVSDGDDITVCGHQAEIWDVSGHTINHIAFIIPSLHAAFTADSMMVMGCGRIFEGDHAMQLATLSKFDQLSGDTMIYSGHEYTQTNIRFALSVDPDNPDLIARSQKTDELRAQNQPTVPASLSLERKTNPFLRVSDAKIRKHLNMENSANLDVFREIRNRRDGF